MTHTRKLTLRRETLTELSPEEMRAMAAGEITGGGICALVVVTLQLSCFPTCMCQ